MVYYYVSGTNTLKTTIDAEVCILRALEKAGVIKITESHGKPNRRVYEIHTKDGDESADLCMHRMKQLCHHFTDTIPTGELTVLKSMHFTVRGEEYDRRNARTLWAYIDDQFRVQDIYWKQCDEESWLCVAMMQTAAECESVIFGEVKCGVVTVYRGIHFEAPIIHEVPNWVLTRLSHLEYDLYGKDVSEILVGSMSGKLDKLWEAKDGWGQLICDSEYVQEHSRQ